MRSLNTSINLTTTQRYSYDNAPATIWSSLLRLVTHAVNIQERALDAPPTSRAGQKRRARSYEDAPKKRRKITNAGSASPVPSSNTVPVFCELYSIQYVAEATVNEPEGQSSVDCNAVTAFLREHFLDQEEDVTVELDRCAVTSRGWRFGTRFDIHEGKSADRTILSIPCSSKDSSRGRLAEWMASLHEIQEPNHTLAELYATPSIFIPAHSTFEDLDRPPFQLHVELSLCFVTPYVFEPTPRSSKHMRTLLGVRSQLLQLAFPPSPVNSSIQAAYQGRTDIPFFYSIVNSAPALPSEEAYLRAQPNELIPSLLPFQRRTVGWMLEKEGKRICENGEIVDVSSLPSDVQTLPPLWDRIKVTAYPNEDIMWYYNRLNGNLTPDFPTTHRPLPGAIVAEEPGLGKTIECISLILLNPAEGRDPSQSHWDDATELNVNHVKTTLIVTPPSLLQQWVNEMHLHAPSLKVLVYEGWQKLPGHIDQSTKNSLYVVGKTAKTKAVKTEGKDDTTSKGSGGPKTWAAYVNSFDVCITTYNVLQQDLNVARAPPKRPRRQIAEYSNTVRRRSPLVCVEFFRVIMDEVQMVGGGRTSEMVSLIPRYSSFAVSGTPARHQLADLIHILRFLRADPSLYESRIWLRLLEPEMLSEFIRLFQFYTTRTMKSAVKDELTIPQQTRFLVPIELGRIERHVYDQEMEKCLQELGLDARGVSATENWEIDTILLRSWLRKLRMICIHPQVGQLNKVQDKTHKPGVLKSMGEVLDGMRDQNWRTLMDSRRQKIIELSRAAQLIQHDKSTDARHKQALMILSQAEKEARNLVDDLKAAIVEHSEKGEVLRREAASLRRARGSPGDANREGDKARADTTSDNEDEDTSGLPKTPAGEEHRHKKVSLQNRLREAYLALHRVKFLQGDVHHVFGMSHEADEAAAYAAADELRKELLKITEDAAISAMTQLSKDAIGSSGVVKDKFTIKTPLGPKGGVRSAELMKEANEIIESGLNAQTELLWDWRKHMHSLLTQPLSATESDAADGQEYSRTLTTQGDAEVYLQVYKALLADRREILVAERTTLAVHESRETKKRKTAAAARAEAAEAENAFEDEFEVPNEEDVEIQPEHEVMHKELSTLRRSIMDQFDGRAVKSIIVQLASVSAKITNDKDIEKILVKECMTGLRNLVAEQSRLNELLENDLARFRKAFNERIQYFRQLQEISDTVMEAEWEGYIRDAIKENDELQADLSAKIKTAYARQRYLNHLAQDGMEEEEDGCILCRCEFKRGFLTECAHAFCEDCMKSWLSRHNKACPVCRVPIHASNLQRFSVRIHLADNSALAPSSLTQDGEVIVPFSRRKIEYNSIPPSIYEEINLMESVGSYGSKIQTLVRHLLYLQLAEPGAKSIVFSAFQDSLQIVEHALRANSISCLRIDDGQGSKRKQPAAVRFQNDPQLQVLLLHGERENAGLNVTCASRVFLLESVVHHSFEIQAIARIDRMGQSRPTEVFCYYAEETIEKNILDLAARRGQSLYTKGRSQGTLDAAPLAPDSEQNVVDAPAKKQQKGDFISKLEDMMSILFPHLVEDVEYLLPPAEDVAAPAGRSAAATTTSGVHVNAIAGPSRLGPL